MAGPQRLPLPSQFVLRRQAAELMPMRAMDGLKARLNFGLVALAVCVGSAMAAFTTTARAETTLRIASSQVSIASIPVVVAIQQKLFQAEGISAEIVDFDGGGPAVQALAGGGVDLCICAGDHAMRLASRGLGGAVLVALLDKHPY